MERLLRKALVVPVVLALLAVLAPAAQAADTWLPRNFDAGTPVYLDPQLANHPSYPVSLPGLAAKLEDLGRKHGLKYYFLMVEQGTEPNLSTTGQKFGAWKLDVFVAQIQSKLPADDYVIVLLVRSAGDPNKFSIAGQGGNRLQQYGLNHLWFNAASGPLEKARRVYLPNDPAGFAAAVAGHVNDGVDGFFAEKARRAEEEKRRQEQAKAEAEREKQRQIEAEKARKAREEFFAALPWYLLVFGTPSLALVALLVLYLRFRSYRNKLLAAIETRQAQFDNANTNYLRLNEEYWPFLKSQGTNWSEKFKGKTLAIYTDAVRKFADLSARMNVSIELLREARACARSKNILSVAELARGHALLATDPVTITGNQLPIDMVSLFGSVVDEKKYDNFSSLQSNMESLFGDTNKALSSIVRSFDGARQNREDIKGLTRSIETAQTDLHWVGLEFAPYKDRFATLKKETEAFLAVLDSDPLEAFSKSESTEESFNQLIARIRRAIELKKSLAGTREKLDKAKAHVADVRSRAVSYAYPDPLEVPAGAPSTFLLGEKDGNPDVNLHDAEEALESAHLLVGQGELEKSEARQKSCENSSTQAVELVARVLEAYAFITRQVPKVRENLGRLQGELPEAGTAVEALKADFLSKNYAGEPEKLAAAQQVSDATESELAKVARAFMEQRYLAGRRTLEQLGSGIQASRDKLVEVHTRLKQLRDLRSHAKKVTAAAGELSSTLSGRLKDHAFTTSTATDRDFAGTQPVLAAAKADVSRDITDWPEAAAAADRLLASLQTVDRNIDDERKANELAVSRVGDVRNAVATADTAVNHHDTRQPARAKLGEAREAMRQLEADLKVAKSDWAAIARRAEQHKKLAVDARQLAEADHRLANEARQAIRNAESEVNRVATRSFMQKAVFGSHSTMITLLQALDLSSAHRAIGQAESDLRGRDYEGAKANAARASSLAGDIEAKALAELAAMVAAKERQWREEERRRQEEQERRERQERERREREDRERREREERNRRDNDWGSSGRSGGGTSHSGGRSGGGVGDF